MRIIVNGQQAFGKACLEAILEKGSDEVVAVYTAPDKEGRPADPVKEAALAHGIAVKQPTDYSDEAVLAEMRALEADLMVMAYVTIFVPEAARNVPKHGSICFHPSLLPLHRGPSSINWPIIWGANKTGLTIFWPDDGLDEGEILLQKEVDIGPDDTLGTVYFKQIFPLGVASMLEAIDLVRAGDPPRISQDDSRATYESWCRKSDAQIDWSRSVGEVYNLIRGTNPQPGAWTTFNGKVLQIYDCAKVEAGGRTGEVVEVSGEGLTVVAGRGAIRIGRVRYDGGEKQAAGQFAAEHGLEKGMRLPT
jgi:methionyl-tRNA formyltransferase